MPILSGSSRCRVNMKQISRLQNGYSQTNGWHRDNLIFDYIFIHWFKHTHISLPHFLFPGCGKKWSSLSFQIVGLRTLLLHPFHFHLSTRLTFPLPFFYFPCCVHALCAHSVLCLALCCVGASGYEAAGWVSETVVSVWQSLWYISRPLPCIIDSPSLITVSSVTDEPLLPAAPCTQRSLWQLESCRGIALKHAGGARGSNSWTRVMWLNADDKKVAVFYAFVCPGVCDIKLLPRYAYLTSCCRHWPFIHCHFITNILIFHSIWFNHCLKRIK